MEATSQRIQPQLQLGYSYCSQNKGIPVQPIRTIEEGVRIIDDILKRNVLCLHLAINEASQAINLLERLIEQVSVYTSLHAL